MWRELPDQWGLDTSRAWMKPDDDRGSADHLARAQQAELPRDPGAPKAARDWVDRHFGPELSDDKLAIAQLLVSELVTNALMHGRGAIILRARLDDGRLRRRGDRRRRRL